MACADENTLLRYLEGVLSPEQAAALEEHLAGCEECRWLLSVAVAGEEPEEGSRAGAGASVLATRQALGEADAPSAPSSTVAAASPSWVGRVLKDTYVLQRFIGKGGMGEVYLASHLRLHSDFAVKLLRHATGTDPEAIARMRQEAEVTSRLKHPNIVELIDFDHTEEGVPYIVMELLVGEPLAQRLRRPLALAEAASILDQAASALAAAHEGGVVHRDLSPTNVFLCEGQPRPRVKVMDFGISKVLGQESGLTADLAVLGSPRYMAPEQALGRSAGVDQRADIFALGAIAYELLCGEPAFAGRSVPEMLFKVVYEEPIASPSWLAVPAPLRALVLRCLSKEPAGRPGSMGQLRRELTEALRQSSQSSLRGLTPSKGRGSRQPGARQRRLLLAAGGLLAAAGAVLAGLYLAAPVGPRAPTAAPDAARLAVASADATRPPRPEGPRPSPGPDAGSPPVVRAGADARAAARSVERTAERPRSEQGCLVVQSKEEGGEYSWANVFLDGRAAGQTALTLRHTRAGWRTVELRRPGYRTLTRRVLVRPHRCTVVRFTLQR